MQGQCCSTCSMFARDGDSASPFYYSENVHNNCSRQSGFPEGLTVDKFIVQRGPTFFLNGHVRDGDAPHRSVWLLGALSL
jgi:hypothetical protein